MPRRQPVIQPVSDDSVEGVFAGQKVKITGRETIYLLVTILALAAAGYLLTHFVDGVMGSLKVQTSIIEDTKQAVGSSVIKLEQRNQQLSDEHRDVNATQQKMVEALVEQNYMLTLSEQKRRQLNLQMPKSLREKTRQRDD